MIDDLPTPPLPLPTAITRVVAGTSVGGADCEARSRAFCMTRRALLLGHLVVLDVDLADAGQARRPSSGRRCRSGPGAGSAAVVERDLDEHVAVRRRPGRRGPCRDRRSRPGARDRGRPRRTPRTSSGDGTGSGVGGVGRSIVLMTNKTSGDLENMPDSQVPSRQWTCSPS